MKRTRQKMAGQGRPRGRRGYGMILVLSLFIVAVLGSSAWQIWKLHVQVDEQLAQLNQEKELLQRQERVLRDEIEQLNTPSYIEKLAREQLGLVKKGEILISPKN